VAQRTRSMIMPGNRKLCMLSTLLVFLLCAGPVRAGIETADLPETATEPQEAETAVETHRHVALQSGYRFITPEGPAAAASPYGRLKSGITGGLSAWTLGPDLKFTIDSDFLHEDEYRAELFLDYAGLVHLHAESRTFWHNLLREQVTPGTLDLKTLDQDMAYGVRTAINQANTRIRLGNNPFHLNLGYWELKRDGFEQLRFSDHYFGTPANSAITTSNTVDRYTREGSIGLDAHLGLFDLSYGFLIRDFTNNATDPRYPFTPNAANIPTGDRHNVIPDSRVTSHTIKLFSDLSGGLVGTASYNLTQRENTAGHGDAVPSGNPSDVVHSVAGDLTYTPSKRHSFSLKYRHREIDRSSPSALFYPFAQIIDPPAGITTATPGELLVRPAPSSVKDALTFSATFRPAPKVIYRLEYNADLERRSNILDAQAPAGSPTAFHSDSRQTHSGTAAFYWIPLNGIKLNASYRYAACDNPAYGASFSDRHTGKLLVTYAKNGKWGLTGSYITRYESGESSAFTVDQNNVRTASHVMPRKQQTASSNTSIWFSPAERLTVTASYSYLETETDQSILFASLIADPSPLVVGNYHSSAHVYGIDAIYAASEALDFSLSFQQVRSRARFELPDRTFSMSGETGTFTTAGITGLTALDTVETGVSALADWRINTVLGCSLDYSFRKYESGQALYDGSVHSTMVTLKARW